MTSEKALRYTMVAMMTSVYVLVERRKSGELYAGYVQHGHEDAGKDNAYRVVCREQGHGDALKPVSGKDW